MSKALRAVTMAAFIIEQGTRVLKHRPHHLGQFYQTAWHAHRSRLTKCHLDQLFPGIMNKQISLIAPLAEEIGNVWPKELIILAALCQYLQPTTVFEIGTFNGRTTVNLAANSLAAIHTLDIPADHPIFRRTAGEERYQLSDSAGIFYRQSEYKDRVTQWWADSAEFDERPLVGTMDLVFVDGAHDDEHMKSDSEKAFRMITDKGTIVWHDYSFRCPGVSDYLEGHELREHFFSIPDTRLVLFTRQSKARR